MNDYRHWQYHGFDIIRTCDIYNTCGKDFGSFSDALEFIDDKCKEMTKAKSYYVVPDVYLYYGVGLYKCVKAYKDAHWLNLGDLVHVWKLSWDFEYMYMVPCNHLQSAFCYELDTFNEYFKCVQLYNFLDDE